MSGQMSDVIVLDTEEFAIVEPSSDQLFDVRAHGVVPVMMHTANTRGVSARYRITDDQLVLADLQVGSVDAPPPIAGLDPTTDDHGQTWTYVGLDHPIAFTGDLIVGAGPIRGLYVHSGFLPVWHYERVIALDIEAGVVQSTEDRSQQVAEFRAEKTGEDSSAGSDPEANDREGGFERFLSSLKIRLGFDEA